MRRKNIHFSSFIDFQWISYDSRVYANKTPRKRIQMTFEPHHDGINGCMFRGETVCRTIFDFAFSVAGCVCVSLLSPVLQGHNNKMQCERFFRRSFSKCDVRQGHFDFSMYRPAPASQTNRLYSICVRLIHIHGVQKKY